MLYFAIRSDRKWFAILCVIYNLYKNLTRDLSFEALTIMSYKAKDNPRSSLLYARDIPLL